jgi:hypothetical protein
LRSGTRRGTPPRGRRWRQQWLDALPQRSGQESVHQGAHDREHPKTSLNPSSTDRPFRNVHLPYCQGRTNGAKACRVVLAARAISVPFTAVTTGAQRTATDNITAALTCTVHRLRRSGSCPIWLWEQGVADPRSFMTKHRSTKTDGWPRRADYGRCLMDPSSTDHGSVRLSLRHRTAASSPQGGSMRTHVHCRLSAASPACPACPAYHRCSRGHAG